MTTSQAAGTDSLVSQEANPLQVNSAGVSPLVDLGMGSSRFPTGKGGGEHDMAENLLARERATRHTHFSVALWFGKRQRPREGLLAGGWQRLTETGSP